MIGRAASSAARRVSSMLAPAPKSRHSNCSIQKQTPFYNRDPSLWTRLAPIPPGQYYVKRTEEYEGSSLQASSSHHKTKTNIFVARYVGNHFSVGSRYVLTPLSFGDVDVRPKYSISHPYPYHLLDRRLDRVECCNGVFCHPVVGDNLVVWNPTTMEVRKLPKSPSTELPIGTCGMENLYIACWADSEEDDYKVIRFFNYDNHFAAADDDDDVFRGFVDVPVEIELYSLKTDSWKNITFTCCEKLTTRIIPPCYADGAVYWSHYDSGRRRAVLMSFDFRSETFSTLPFPPLGGMTRYELVRCNGQLSVLTWNIDHRDGQKGHWVMPLGFARNGEVVLFERRFVEPQMHHVLMAFDSITGELKQVPGFASGNCLKVFEFAETFVKLKPSSSSVAIAGEDGGLTQDACVF